MTFAAISYKVKPGSEDEIAEALASADAERAGSAGPDGALISTALFFHDDTVVTVVQLGDDPADPADLDGHKYILQTEERLAPYVLGERGTMRRIQQRLIADRPARQLAAMRHTIKPGSADAIAEVFANTKPAGGRPGPGGGAPGPGGPGGGNGAPGGGNGGPGGGNGGPGLIEAVALFVHEQTMVRVVQYNGELADIAAFMRDWGARSNLESLLDPYMDEDRHFETPEEFEALWWRHNMRQISMTASADQAADPSTAGSSS